ncbi:7,8-didemethyl-8-hydroxy-5-deazariboflavin synthase [Chromatiales bacterium (ex Bugula neritina AB1)]|nr:7,8-didemethyl-8-hydroxy-5-deazariboflavin synthase [Chromatiales bacterium (ex Bugula neritina AB1)]
MLGRQPSTRRLTDNECHDLLNCLPQELISRAALCRDEGHGTTVSYSRKVFIPLTQLCRDVCHYCTFAKPPSGLADAYLSPEQVLDIARAGAAMNCKEALFTLGDKPELRYPAARDALNNLGYDTTIEYLCAVAGLVYRETGLLPHLNPGVMTEAEIASLREVSVSMGIMLESTSGKLLKRGGCHFGSPDKNPQVRLATINSAGELGVPFTSGILIGIGETRADRIESLLALRKLHEQHGHLQEIIVQNFKAKPGTLMANATEPDLAELQWSIAVARLIFGAQMSIQAPPNLSAGHTVALVEAGINDWGGVSPLTPDHVNPEAPWPHLDDLSADTAKAGKVLVERLGIYPEYCRSASLHQWLAPTLHKSVLDFTDADGLARTDPWCPGTVDIDLPVQPVAPFYRKNSEIDNIIDRAFVGKDLSQAEVERLFAARGDEVVQITRAADQLRTQVSGETVSYVVTRNINYTNICYFKCRFCAFSKGKTSENLRGKPYNLNLEEIVGRARQAWDRGAVEVCLQGGIHPEYTGQTYLDILQSIKHALPEIHVHAFSPLEIHQGAETLGIPVREFLQRLIDAGLGSLPGTAAEILDDEVRSVICPDKINTAQWFDVINTAHQLNLKTTATIMFGHVDQPANWSRHLLALRDQQQRTGGFTELVPLPFVHMEAPLYRKGGCRRGPTWRECLLMHAVSRLVLHPHIPNIQTSWVKLGASGIKACLDAGANDVGGTLMNETITRAAGAGHGQEMTPQNLERILAESGRPSRQRTTLYKNAPEVQQRVSYRAPVLIPVSRAASAGPD